MYALRRLLCVIFPLVLISLTANPASAMLNPTLGRFLQEDPSGYVDGLNKYQYVNSSPSGAGDPTGLSCVTVMSGTAPPVPDGTESYSQGVSSVSQYFVNTLLGPIEPPVNISTDDSYLSRLIRSSPGFEGDRENLIDDIKSNVEDWVKGMNCKGGGHGIGMQRQFGDAIYDPSKSSANPYNWWTGQLSIGEFVANVGAVGRINETVSSGRMTGGGNVQIYYDVDDQWHLHIEKFVGSEPGQFQNHISWSETVNVVINCSCCK
jgi:hypothetical protein